MSITLMKLRNFFGWLDEHSMLLLAGFLLVFIPLFPKIPVWSPIEQYIVRVRLEDFFILFSVLILFIQMLRKKVFWRSPMFVAVAIYEVVALMSTLSAIFVTATIPLEWLHIEKSMLHFFRYIEYFSLFFIAFAAVKRKRDVLVLLSLFAATVIGVSVYGYGQKYYYWPVYSTMNREFSKGERLVLTPHARVQSTFAGHYDMAAFLVIALPLLLTCIFYFRKWPLRLLFIVSYIFATWLIIMSASRTSFIAFMVGIILVIGFSALQKGSWRQKLRLGLISGVVVLIVSVLLVFAFGGDLSDRFSQVVETNPRLHTLLQGFSTKGLASLFSHSIQPTTAPVPSGAITTDQAIQMGILNPTDERPVPATSATPTPQPSPSVAPSPVAKPKKLALKAKSQPAPSPSVIPVATQTAVPADVYVNVPDIVQVATKSASGASEVILVNKGPRIYSQNAIAHGLSLAIRLDSSWPEAIKGFETNPLLGKGYATLDKGQNLEQFTEAESTDNNFLRTLGETGALGFITFYGCILLVIVYGVKSLRSDDLLLKAFGIGMIGASIGFLLNAVYIDVFAASKDAEMYWALSGIFLGYFFVVHRQQLTPVVIDAKDAELAPIETKLPQPKKRRRV